MCVYIYIVSLASYERLESQSDIQWNNVLERKCITRKNSRKDRNKCKRSHFPCGFLFLLLLPILRKEVVLKGRGNNIFSLWSFSLSVIVVLFRLFIAPWHNKAWEGLNRQHMKRFKDYTGKNTKDWNMINRKLQGLNRSFSLGKTRWFLKLRFYHRQGVET